MASAVTSTDIRGTAVIVLGVILIMVFSSINHGLQQAISIERSAYELSHRPYRADDQAKRSLASWRLASVLLLHRPGDFHNILGNSPIRPTTIIPVLLLAH
jgi:hypothetical protein